MDCREILFGGAKGPGKTSLLLMAALRYVHVPGYSALILRRSTKEARQANSIMDRLQRWTASTDATWNLTDSTCRFQSGAMFKFGYISNMQDAYQFQSSEYTLIVFDELTDFDLSENEELNPYLFMFGMNRKPKIGCSPLLNMVPLQVISGTNPGGRSHAWVKKRFITDEALEAISDPVPRAFYTTPKRCYVPALIKDNPAIDAEQYIEESLSHLGPTTKARFVSGDWSVQEGSLISYEQFQWYEQRGDIYMLNGVQYPLAKCRRFATIDTAGSGKDKEDEQKGKNLSWTVCGIWDTVRHGDATLLFLRHIYRSRAESIVLRKEIPDLLSKHSCKVVRIECATIGNALASELRAMNYRVEMLNTVLPEQVKSGDKTAKKDRFTASGLDVTLANGWLCLPLSRPPWLDTYTNELTSWCGLPTDVADQVDITSYAAFHARQQRGQWDGPVTVAAGGRVNSMSLMGVHKGARR